MLEQAKAITPESGISKSGPAEKQKETTSIIVEFEEKKHAEEQDKPVQSSAPTATPAPASKPKEDEGVNSKPAQIPEATSDPTPNPQPESIPEPESEPAFDISYWVSFAKTYGQQIGLSYDSQATDCWDNPILASPKSIYLERDISSRLSRYVREGMTAFCVWSEQLPDGRYNIYIGSA